MKIFVKPYFLKKSYPYYYSLKLNKKLYGLSKYSLVDNPILADIIVLQIGEINDLLELPNKYCFLYFHFQPDQEETIFINNLLVNLVNHDKITLLSPYTNLLGDTVTNTLVIPWGTDTTKFTSSRLEVNDKINIYYPGDEEPNDITRIKEKINLQPYNNLLEDILITPHLIIVKEQWDNVFNHDLNICLDQGAVPIVMPFTSPSSSSTPTLLKPSNYLGVYEKFVVSGTTQSEWLENYREKSAQPLDFSSLSWQTHLAKVVCHLDSLEIGEGKIDSFIFIPFLDMPRYTDHDSSSNSDEITSLVSKCHGKLNCFSTSGYLNSFYPWGLSHYYTSPEKGIYIKKTVYQKSNLPETDLVGYTSFPMMSYDEFTINISVGKKNYQKEEIIKTHTGNLKSAILPFHRWRFSQSDGIYIKNPNIQDRFALATFLDHLDFLPFLKATLTSFNSLQCQSPIYLFYQQNLFDLPNFSLLYPNLKIKCQPLEIPEGPGLDNDHKFNILTSLLMCPAEIVLYFKPNVYFFQNPDLINQANYQTSLFFESGRDYSYGEHTDYKKWCILNLTTQEQGTVGLSEACFLYHRKKNWYSLLIAMGLRQESFIAPLHSTDILKLGLLANQEEYVVKNKETMISCMGTLHNELLIGWPERKWDTFHFTQIPLWIRIHLPTHKLNNLDRTAWYFEPLMWSLITNAETSEKLSDDNNIIEVLESIRKMCV